VPGPLFSRWLKQTDAIAKAGQTVAASLAPVKRMYAVTVSRMMIAAATIHAKVTSQSAVWVEPLAKATGPVLAPRPRRRLDRRLVRRPVRHSHASKGLVEQHA